MTTSNIGAAVKKAREDVNYSIDDLAETCGLTAIEINDVEIGKDCDPAKIKRIAAALHIAVDF